MRILLRDAAKLFSAHLDKTSHNYETLRPAQLKNSDKEKSWELIIMREDEVSGVVLYRVNHKEWNFRDEGMEFMLSFPYIYDSLSNCWFVSSFVISLCLKQKTLSLGSTYVRSSRSSLQSYPFSVTLYCMNICIILR